MMKSRDGVQLSSRSADSAYVPLFTDPLIRRLIPADDPDARFFWSSGADGHLRVHRCVDCSHFVHPPTGHCPWCGSRHCAPHVVSGNGRVHTFTVNYQPWVHGQDPYIIVIVELDEQAGLRLTSNLVNCSPDEVIIGMPVRVGFVARHGFYYPLFEPRNGQADG
jgi:uncharacterized OB-fold protein